LLKGRQDRVQPGASAKASLVSKTAIHATDVSVEALTQSEPVIPTKADESFQDSTQGISRVLPAPSAHLLFRGRFIVEQRFHFFERLQIRRRHVHRFQRILFVIV
jgi:hypothetical protein